MASWPRGNLFWLISVFLILFTGWIASIAQWHHVLRSTQASSHIEASALSLFAQDWLQLRALLRGQASPGLATWIEAWFYSNTPQPSVRTAARTQALLSLDFTQLFSPGLSALRFFAMDSSERRCAALYSGLGWVCYVGALVSMLKGFGASTGAWWFMCLVILIARIAGCFTPALGGFGPRELCFALGLGLSPNNIAAIASSGILLLSLQLGGAALGSLVVRRMQLAQLRQTASVNSFGISVIIPTYNEAVAITETVRRVRLIPEVKECIVVDGGSSDRTTQIAENLGCTVLRSSPGRGRQLRLGAQHAQQPIVLLLHADAWLTAESGAAIQRCLADPTVVAGGLWKRFRDRPGLLVGSRPKCLIRVILGRRIVGDMACFVRRDALIAIDGVPDMELMEDFALSARLRQLGRLALADATLTTSARRFRKHGVIATYLKMWRVTWLYRLGTPPSELRKIYQTCTESESNTIATKVG